MGVGQKVLMDAEQMRNYTPSLPEGQVWASAWENNHYITLHYIKLQHCASTRMIYIL